MEHFTGRVVLVVGASGGLGATIARAFAKEGAHLALAARRSLSVEQFADLDSGALGSVSLHQADLTDPASLLALREAVLAAHGRVDVVINAAGHDVRKALAEHSLADFRQTLGVNLLGAMLLTQTFLPIMSDGVIAHLGGFADGRLAFPFYSADAASRAGLRAFIEAANRELVLAHRPVTVTFFSPSPADTEAERPFHALWRQMGTPIVSPEQVAGELVQTVARREKVHIMGGLLTRAFAGLNAICSPLADALMMNQYSSMLANYFNSHLGASMEPQKKSPCWRKLGLGLVVFSFVAYGLLLGVPFVPLGVAEKTVLASALVALGEITFWVGGAILGEEMIRRFRRYLNPCQWRRSATK